MHKRRQGRGATLLSTLRTSSVRDACSTGLRVEKQETNTLLTGNSERTVLSDESIWIAQNRIEISLVLAKSFRRNSIHLYPTDFCWLLFRHLSEEKCKPWPKRILGSISQMHPLGKKVYRNWKKSSQSFESVFTPPVRFSRLGFHLSASNEEINHLDEWLVFEGLHYLVSYYYSNYECTWSESMCFFCYRPYSLLVQIISTGRCTCLKCKIWSRAQLPKRAQFSQISTFRNISTFVWYVFLLSMFPFRRATICARTTTWTVPNCCCPLRF